MIFLSPNQQGQKAMKVFTSHELFEINALGSKETIVQRGY